MEPDTQMDNCAGKPRRAEHRSDCSVSSGLRVATPTHQQLRMRWRGRPYGLSAFRRSSSGSLAKFAAMRRASSRVSSLAAERH